LHQVLNLLPCPSARLQIFDGIRDFIVQSVELKFNCFFLMPLVDTFPQVLFWTQGLQHRTPAYSAHVEANRSPSTL
jgi:hypothetical protein